jgi:hypothetical protein
MTTPISGQWIEEGEQNQFIPEQDAEEEVIGIPVRLVSEPRTRRSPEFAGWVTYTIQQAGTMTVAPYCTQLLQRRYQRYKAKFSPCTWNAGTTSVLFSSQPAGLSNPNLSAAIVTGWVMTATGLTLPDYDAEQPLYAIAIGGTATLSILDETYGDTRIE